MTLTAEQADQARGIILDCLNVHDQNRVPFKQVWTKPTRTSKATLSSLSGQYTAAIPAASTSVCSIPSTPTSLSICSRPASAPCRPVSYVHESETDQLSTQWTGQS